MACCAGIRLGHRGRLGGASFRYPLWRAPDRIASTISSRTRQRPIAYRDHRRRGPSLLHTCVPPEGGSQASAASSRDSIEPLQTLPSATTRDVIRNSWDRPSLMLYSTIAQHKGSSRNAHPYGWPPPNRASVTCVAQLSI